jgi:hypothetical protein
MHIQYEIKLKQKYTREKIMVPSLTHEVFFLKSAVYLNGDVNA